MDDPLALALVLVTTSVLSVFAAVMIAASVEGRPMRQWFRRALAPPANGDAVFLWADGGIADANAAAQALLDTLQSQAGTKPASGDPSSLLARHLTALFPGLADRLSAPGPEDWNTVANDGSDLQILVETVDGAQRITLTDPEQGDGIVPVDRLSWRALNDELDMLRRTTDRMPTPAWRESHDGRIVWANGAYLSLIAEIGRNVTLTWPLPALFPADAGERGGRHGVTLTLAGGRVRWFDLVAVADGPGRLICALPADEAQRAERARREFVQTLSRTFATLAIGLAVFDRTRRLQLFNPALIDLTGLEPEFLASRPGIEGFLNRMRDKHIMPEPRDYRAWSRRLLEVETAAQGGGFEETWALPDGRSFRISAAPHPDGALAFLIEDVTSDIRLKRSFRTELDTIRATLDLVDQAIAVFAPGGELLLTNAAFDRAWTLDGADTLAGVNLRDAVAHWRTTGGAPALWDRILAMAGSAQADGEVRGPVDLGGGEVLDLCVRQAPGGAVILAFAEPGPGTLAAPQTNTAPGWAGRRVAHG